MAEHLLSSPRLQPQRLPARPTAPLDHKTERQFKVLQTAHAPAQLSLFSRPAPLR